MYQFLCATDESQNVIKMPSMISLEHAEAFAAQTQGWLFLPVEAHVLDFTGVELLDRRIYPFIAIFAKALRTNKKAFYTTNMSITLLKQIKSDGLTNLFTPPKPPIPKIDVGFINPFIQAVTDIFLTQAQTTVIGQKPCLRSSDTTLDIGIIGFVAINTSKFRGNVALCFPTSVFLKIYERMLGETHHEITQETEDAVGELLNMVYGQVKTRLNKDMGYDFQPALPAVLRGEKISVRQQSKHPVIVLPFNTDIGNFYLEIATDPFIKNEQRSA